MVVGQDSQRLQQLPQTPVVPTSHQPLPGQKDSHSQCWSHQQHFRLGIGHTNFGIPSFTHGQRRPVVAISLEYPYSNDSNKPRFK